MIYNLQLLRGMAALAVVYLHVVSEAGLGLNIGIGNFGVDLFFVISGFTMAYAGRMAAAEFVVRRVIRIVPMYWLATLGTFVVARFAPALVQSASASVPHLLHSLFFVPYPNKLGLLQPTLALGWTLNYEMYFYALFAAALLFTRRHAPILACVFLLLVAVALWAAGSHDDVARFYADSIVSEFALGVLVYYATARATIGRMALLAGAMITMLILPLGEWLALAPRAVSAGLPAAILLYCVVLLEKRFAMAAKNRWVVMIGDSSYVLYLTHPYVVYGIARLFLNPAAMGTAALGVAVLGLAMAAVVTAVVIHFAVERPLTRYLRVRSTACKPFKATNIILAKE